MAAVAVQAVGTPQNAPNNEKILVENKVLLRDRTSTPKKVPGSSLGREFVPDAIAAALLFRKLNGQYEVREIHGENLKVTYDTHKIAPNLDEMLTKTNREINKENNPGIQKNRLLATNGIAKALEKTLAEMTSWLTPEKEGFANRFEETLSTQQPYRITHHFSPSGKPQVPFSLCTFEGMPLSIGRFVDIEIIDYSETTKKYIAEKGIIVLLSPQRDPKKFENTLQTQASLKKPVARVLCFDEDKDEDGDKENPIQNALHQVNDRLRRKAAELKNGGTFPLSLNGGKRVPLSALEKKEAIEAVAKKLHFDDDEDEDRENSLKTINHGMNNEFTNKPAEPRRKGRPEFVVSPKGEKRVARSALPKEETLMGRAANEELLNFIKNKVLNNKALKNKLERLTCYTFEWAHLIACSLAEDAFSVQSKDNLVAVPKWINTYMSMFERIARHFSKNYIVTIMSEAILLGDSHLAERINYAVTIQRGQKGQKGYRLVKISCSLDALEPPGRNIPSSSDFNQMLHFLNKTFNEEPIPPKNPVVSYGPVEPISPVAFSAIRA